MAMRTPTMIIQRLALVILLATLSTFMIFMLIYLVPGAHVSGNPILSYTYWLKIGLTGSSATGIPVSALLATRTSLTLAISIPATLLLILLAWSLSWNQVCKQSKFAKVVGDVLSAVSGLPGIAVSFTVVLVCLVTWGVLLDASTTLGWSRRLIAGIVAVWVLAITDGRLGMALRHLREEISRIRSQPFVVALAARGVNVERHIRRNLIPSVTALGIGSSISILGWTFVIERIFGIRGLGYQLVTEFQNGNYEMILLITGISTVLTLIIRLIGEIVIALFDPRLRVSQIKQGLNRQVFAPSKET